MTEPFSVKETDQEISDINFEPGAHPITEAEYSALRQGITSGDLTAHAWNQEVGQRIKKRAFDKPALVIAIDGDTADPFSGNKPSTVNEVGNDLQTWAAIPGRPNELSHTGIVYAVRGDTEDNWTPAVALEGTNSDNPTLDISSGYVNAADQILNRSKSIETVLRPVIYMGIMFGSSEVAKKVSQLMPLKIERRLPNNISRRQFLKIAAFTIGGMILAASPDLGSSAQAKSSFAPDDFSMKLLQRIDELASAKLFRSSWLNARTGMLFSKMEDVQAAGFALPEGTEYDIVMGSGHDTDQDFMHRNKKARSEALNDYAKSMINDGKRAYAIFTGTSEKQVPEAAVNRLLDFLSLTELVKVTDPGGSDKQRDLMQNVTSYFKSVAKFHSPQVEDAVKILRP